MRMFIIVAAVCLTVASAIAGFCPECGHKVSGSPKFCPDCGTRLGSGQQQQQQQQQQVIINVPDGGHSRQAPAQPVVVYKGSFVLHENSIHGKTPAVWPGNKRLLLDFCYNRGGATFDVYPEGAEYDDKIKVDVSGASPGATVTTFSQEGHTLKVILKEVYINYDPPNSSWNTGDILGATLEVVVTRP